MRVIAGQYRGRPLRSLRGLDLRPTADRLRQTLFDVLGALGSPPLQDAVWLDLYAGTGAIGIEALSRGAANVYFVESSPSAAALIRDNLRSLRIETGFEVSEREADTALRRLATQAVACDFCFLDPPYRLRQAYGDTLDFLARSSLLRPEAVVIAEHEKRFDPGERFASLQRFRLLRQGDAALSFYRVG